MISLRAGILSDPNSWHSQRLLAAFKKWGIEPVFSLASQIQAGLGGERYVASQKHKLDELDLLLVREVPGGSLEQVIYRMDALHQLEDSGVRIINRPGAIEKMVDKYYTSSLLARAGLRVPETVVTESGDEALQAFDWLGRDVVLKPLFGSQGVGMVRLTDRDVAIRALRALELGRYIYYLQRFIPHANRDVRLLMLGDDCAAAMLRSSDSWKTNISQGASPANYVPTLEELDLSRRAAQAVGADYCGVDLLPGEDGQIYLLEVNSMPAWKGLQSVSQPDLAEMLVAFCLSQLGIDPYPGGG